jgi:hypothetical protein
MAMPLVHRRIRRQAIEVALTFYVINPNSLSTRDDHIEGMIVVGSEAVFELDEFLGVGAFQYGHEFSWCIDFVYSNNIVSNAMRT